MNNDGLVAAVLNAPIVETATGLMFIYLLASLIASAVKEMVAGVFQWRGTYLQQGIGVLLSNAPGTAFAWGGALKWFVAHVTWVDPTRKSAGILAVAADLANAATTAVATGKAFLAAPAHAAVAPPAAVTDAADAASAAADGAVTALDRLGATAVSKEVAAAVRGVIAAARQAVSAVRASGAGPLAEAEAALAAATAAVRVLQVQTHPLIKGTPSRLPSYVPARDFATAMLDMLRDGSANPVFSQVERTVAALPDGDMKRILTAFIQDAAGDLDQLRVRIETWFDDAMDRLSGIYKRFAQYFLLALGMLMAVVLNIDSVHLAANLYEQPALRAAILAEAQGAVQGAAQGSGTHANAPPPGPASGTPTLDTSGSMQPQIDQADHLALPGAVQQIQGLPLPIGRFPCANFFGQPDSAAPQATAVPRMTAISNKPRACAASHDYPGAWRWAAWTVLGWVITGLAISLGAPFWFGLLQNVMNLRAAGSPPSRADETLSSRGGV